MVQLEPTFNHHLVVTLALYVFDFLLSQYTNSQSKVALWKQAYSSPVSQNCENYFFNPFSFSRLLFLKIIFSDSKIHYQKTFIFDNSLNKLIVNNSVTRLHLLIIIYLLFSLYFFFTLNQNLHRYNFICLILINKILFKTILY